MKMEVLFGQFGCRVAAFWIALGLFSPWIPAEAQSGQTGDFRYQQIGSAITIAAVIPETVKPKLTIAVPKPNLVISNSLLNIHGTSSDNAGVSVVSYRVGTNAWTVGQGITNWAGQVMLSPGINWVQAFAVDINGNVSATVSNKVTYVPCAHLSITVDGDGAISGAAVTKNHASFQAAIGKPVKLTATAAKGQMFEGWNGFIYSPVATISFTMPAEDVNLTARFVTSPIAAAAGVYKGLIQPSDPLDVADAGAFAVTVSPNGAFSAKLTFQAQTVTGSGWLGIPWGQETDSTCGFSFKRGNRNFEAEFYFSPEATSQVAGVLLLDLKRVPGAGRAIPPSMMQAEFQGNMVANTNLGRYNVAVVPESSTGLGYGYGWVTVSNRGVKINLTLPDEKAVVTALATDRLRDGTMPLFAPLYGNKGFLFGWLTASNQQVLASSVVWYKEPAASKTFFKDGFDQTVEVQGGAYTPVADLNQWGTCELVVDGQAVPSGYLDYGKGFYLKSVLSIPVSEGLIALKPWTIAPATGLVKLNANGVSGGGVLVSDSAANPGIYGFTTSTVEGVGAVHSIRSGPLTNTP